MSKLVRLAIPVVVFLGLAPGAQAQANPTSPAVAPAPAPYPAQAPAPYPAQAPAPYPAPAYPAASGAPNPALESPYGHQPVVAYPAPAPQVQSRVLPRGYRTHDGFFLRMLNGPGVGGTSYRDSLGLIEGGNGVDTRTLGVSFMTELAIGGAIAENLILHVTMNLAHSDEEKKVANQDWGDEELSTLMGFFGGGVTYFFMPANVYITGAIGVGGLSQTSGNDRVDHGSGTGFGTSFAVGKEWWLGRTGQWAIGVALTGSYYQAPLELSGVESTYRGYHTGLAFSTTFN